jgi:uncharacterized membrane protein
VNTRSLRLAAGLRAVGLLAVGLAAGLVLLGPSPAQAGNEEGNGRTRLARSAVAVVILVPLHSLCRAGHVTNH